MVITDVPFDARERAKRSRYNLIRGPETSVVGTVNADQDEDEEATRSKEYAAFLK